jgi:hypothetical protein
MAVAKVFQSLDIVETILNNFEDLPHVAGARYVSTLFNSVGKAIYDKKQKEHNSKVEAYKLAIHKQVEDNLVRCNLSPYNVRLPIQYNVTMIAMLHTLQDIYVEDWSSYVQSDMDQIWKDLIVLMKGVSEGYKFPNCIYTCKDFALGQYLGDIMSLMYVYDTNIFKVCELKSIAKMKGIRNASTMKRSKLVKLLTRPEEESYIYTA